jgi:hypothetical protein
MVIPARPSSSVVYPYAGVIENLVVYRHVLLFLHFLPFESIIVLQLKRSFILLSAHFRVRIHSDSIFIFDCSKFGARECRCSGDHQCQLCCQHAPHLRQNCSSPFAQFVEANGEFSCTPVSTAVTSLTTNYDSSCYADDPTDVANTIYVNNPLFDPSCSNQSSSGCTHMLFLASSTPCNGGVCSANGLCISLSPTTLSSLSFRKWIDRNLVGAIIVLIICAWIPLSCIVHLHDIRRVSVNKNDILCCIQVVLSFLLAPFNYLWVFEIS